MRALFTNSKNTELNFKQSIQNRISELRSAQSIAVKNGEYQKASKIEMQIKTILL